MTVFAATFTPGLTSGRALRSHAIIRALAALGPVDVVYVPFGEDAAVPVFDEPHPVRLRAVTPSRGARRLMTYARARAARVPDQWARGMSPELVDAVAEVHTAGRRIVADGPSAAVALQRLGEPVIYCSHNLESAFRPGMGDADGDELARFERRLLTRSAECWMVSPKDIEGARRLAPDARLRLVPNVIDVGAVAPLPDRGAQRRLVFVGDLAYPPNREAVGFLVEEAMPALWRTDPDVELLIGGRGGEGLPADEPRARLVGFVEDLREFYDGASAAVVPLLQGGGTPLKFVEALAYRLPIVATPLAAQGLEAVAGEHYLEFAFDAEGFAAASRIALDPGRAQPVADAGRVLAERRYSIEALKECVGP